MALDKEHTIELLGAHIRMYELLRKDSDGQIAHAMALVERVLEILLCIPANVLHRAILATLADAAIPAEERGKVVYERIKTLKG